VQLNSSFSFGKKRYNGRTDWADWADWADLHGFFELNARILSKKIKKNPCQSAESAQSVLPLYRHFPNEKLLAIEIKRNNSWN
jgi:hypothetical protein